jgi:hypothetical protein
MMPLFLPLLDFPVRLGAHFLNALWLGLIGQKRFALEGQLRFDRHLALAPLKLKFVQVSALVLVVRNIPH